MGSHFGENDITGIYINLRYQNQLLSLTTGIAYNVFSTDKSLDAQWDKLVMKFLLVKQIRLKKRFLPTHIFTHGTGL